MRRMKHSMTSFRSMARHRSAQLFFFLPLTALAFATSAWGQAGYKSAAVSEQHAVLRGDFAASGQNDFDVQRFNLGGTFLAPLQDNLGVAINGEVGFAHLENDVEEDIGAGADVFWRDPNKGFAGLGYSWDRISFADRHTADAFVGMYRGDWDFEMSGGFNGGDGEEIGFFRAGLANYLTPDVRLGAGFSTASEETFAAEFSGDWRPLGADSRLVLTADVGGGTSNDDGFYTVGFGAIVHFAKPKTLIRQLREDRLNRQLTP